jgi:hypothetical protein
LSSGGDANRDGSPGSKADSSAPSDASAKTGGIVGAGGIVGRGGSVGTGGVMGTGGVVGAGGAGAGGAGTGGAGTGGAGTGGASAVVCGTVKSILAQTITFGALDSGTAMLGTSPATPPAGAQLAYTTVGPTANPTLCTAGCATLSMAYASGMASWRSVSAIKIYSPTTNLVGSTVAFTIAIDNPVGLSIQVQAYAEGDASSGWTWSTPATLGGTGLTPYAAAGGFKDFSVTVADTGSGSSKYCASSTAQIGIQLQNKVAITSANAGTVTIYIGKITVTPPA